MKEAFFILVVLVVLAALTAYRYRRQIGAMMQLWRALNSVRQRRPADSQIGDEPATAGPLVNCPKCGKWVAEEKAIRLGRAAYYCSTKCLEASVKTA